MFDIHHSIIWVECQTGESIVYGSVQLTALTNTDAELLSFDGANFIADDTGTQMVVNYGPYYAPLLFNCSIDVASTTSTTMTCLTEASPDGNTLAGFFDKFHRLFCLSLSFRLLLVLFRHVVVYFNLAIIGLPPLGRWGGLVQRICILR